MKKYFDEICNIEGAKKKNGRKRFNRTVAWLVTVCMILVYVPLMPESVAALEAEGYDNTQLSSSEQMEPLPAVKATEYQVDLNEAELREISSEPLDTAAGIETVLQMEADTPTEDETTEDDIFPDINVNTDLNNENDYEEKNAAEELIIEPMTVFMMQTSGTNDDIYNADDIAVINNLIDNGSLNFTEWTTGFSDPPPDDWNVEWSVTELNRRIIALNMDGVVLNGTLTLSGLDELERLICNWNNDLTNLELSNLTKLNSLNLSSNNKLNSVNFYNLPSLRAIEVTNNESLAELDLSALVSLESVAIIDTPITNLKLAADYELFFEINGRGSLSINVQMGLLSADPFVILEAIPADDHNFNGWTFTFTGNDFAGFGPGETPRFDLNLPKGTQVTVIADFFELQPGSYNADDIMAVNAMIENNDLSIIMNEWSNGSLAPPPCWADYIIWSRGDDNKRVKKINLSGGEWGSTLSGIIEVFGLSNGLSELEILNCSENDSMTGLIVSDLPKLIELNAANSRLAAINLSNLSTLNTLNVSNNRLTTLSLTGLIELEELDCSNNYLPLLDLSGLNELKILNLRENMLTELDVTALKKLEKLNCSFNRLTSLNITDLPLLRVLDCEGNQLTELSLNGTSNLRELNCSSNRLTSLSVSNLPSLRILDCEDNRLAELDVTALKELEELNCSYNDLAGELDISGLSRLKKLNCAGIGLKALDVSGLSGLEELYCGFNEINELNLSNISGLRVLDCERNNLTELDLTGLINLRELSCARNRLSVLDLKDQKGLIKLDCSHNLLTILDLSLLADLEELDCSDNMLTVLNVSGLTRLVDVSCQNNMLTVLDFSMVAVLLFPQCGNNPIKSLKLPNGVEINIEKNPDSGGTVMLAGLEKEEIDAGEFKHAHPRVTFEATPAAGYRFDGWTVEIGVDFMPMPDVPPNPISLLLPDEDVVTLTALFTADVNAEPAYYQSDRTAMNKLIDDLSLGLIKWEQGDVPPLNWVGHVTWSSHPVNKRIIRLNLSNMNLEGTLDVTVFEALEELNCYNNELTELKLSGLEALTNLRCGNNNLTELNFTGLLALVQLDCHGNDLTVLDLSGQPELSQIISHKNPLTDLKLPDDVELVLSAGRGGSIELDSYRLMEGRPSVLVTATVNDGFTFDKWDYKGAELLSNPAVTDKATFILNSGKNEITARFVHRYGGEPQDIGFAVITEEKNYGDDIFTHTASLIAGEGEVTYSSSDETVAKVNASTGAVTILKPGTTTITATAAAVPNEWLEASASYTLNISPRTITVTAGSYTVDKIYDGTAAKGTGSGYLNIEGLLTVDGMVSIVPAPQPYSGINVGGYSVIVDLSIYGDTDGKYVLSDNTVTVTGMISPKSVTVRQGGYSVSKVYDGTMNAGTGSGDLSYDALSNGAYVTAVPDDYPSADAGLHEIEVFLTLAGAGAGNYKLTDEILTIINAQITKAVLVTENQPVVVRYDNTNPQIFSVANVVDGYAGTFNYNVGTVTDAGGILDVIDVTVSDGILRFNLVSGLIYNDLVVQTAEIQVSVSGFRNYDDVLINVVITLTDCVHPSTTVTVITAPGCMTDGESMEVCDHCDAVIGYAVIDMTGHTPAYDWDGGYAATCTSASTRTKSCLDCSETLEREIRTALGHDFGKSNNNGTHSCRRAGCNVTANCSPSSPGSTCAACSYRTPMRTSATPAPTGISATPVPTVTPTAPSPSPEPIVLPEEIAAPLPLTIVPPAAIVSPLPEVTPTPAVTEPAEAAAAEEEEAPLPADTEAVESTLINPDTPTVPESTVFAPEQFINEAVIGEILQSDTPVINLTEVFGTVISANMLKAIADNGVDVEVIMDNGYSFTLIADSISDGAADFDFNIDIFFTDADDEIEGVNIPANSIVIAPNFSGEFGFEVKLTFSLEQLLEAGLDGENIRLFHVDYNNNITDLGTATQMPDGSVEFTIDRASYYVLAKEMPLVGTMSSASHVKDGGNYLIIGILSALAFLVIGGAVTLIILKMRRRKSI